MVGIYFSGTGNTEFCIKKFMQGITANPVMSPIEEKKAVEYLTEELYITLAYPIYYSNLPKIVKDFIDQHAALWKGKEVFIIATMGLFSGDGAGLAARRLKKYGAKITGGLHLKMPDCVADVKKLKKSIEENKAIVKRAELKIERSVEKILNGGSVHEGLGAGCHLAGLFGQRLYFYNKTAAYSDKLKINKDKCAGCGVCMTLCPMHNMILKKGKSYSMNRCTMCYRCISNCPNQAITLLGDKVIEQSKIERYLD